jgi:hypothetical protein
MVDTRFVEISDDDLADIWYALGGAAIRHTEHFKRLFDAVADELLTRLGVDGLQPFLNQRFHQYRLADSKEDILANISTPPGQEPDGVDNSEAGD